MTGVTVKVEIPAGDRAVGPLAIGVILASADATNLCTEYGVISQQRGYINDAIPITAKRVRLCGNVLLQAWMPSIHV